MPNQGSILRLTLASLRRGVRVIWLGQDHLGDIFSPDLVAHNRMLQHGHPGKVLGDDPWHVTVEWLGLEQEPVSWGVGHNPDPNGTFQFLGLVADTEWEQAAAAGWWANPS